MPRVLLECKIRGRKRCTVNPLTSAGFSEAAHRASSESRLMLALNRMYRVYPGRENALSWLRRPVKNHWDGWTQMDSVCQRRSWEELCQTKRRFLVAISLTYLWLWIDTYSPRGARVQHVYEAWAVLNASSHRITEMDIPGWYSN